MFSANITRQSDAPPASSPGLGRHLRVGLIRKVAARNLCLNPNFLDGQAASSTSPGNWTLTGGTSSWAMGYYGQQYPSGFPAFGSSLFQQAFMLPNIGAAGTLYTTFSATAGTTYYCSIYVGGTYYSQGSLNLCVLDNTGATVISSLTPVKAPVTNREGTYAWQRFVVVYTETTSTTRRLALVNGTGSTITVRASNCQIEADRLTTYFDGDFRGLNPYAKEYSWEGPNNSSSSYRNGSAVNGGEVIWFDQIGVDVLAVDGLGLEGLGHFLSERATVDGSDYLDSRMGDRTATLTLGLKGRSPQEVEQARTLLSRIMDARNSIPRQPFAIRFQWVTDLFDGVTPTELAPPMDAYVLYQGGLSGISGNEPYEVVSVKLGLYESYTLVSEYPEGINYNVTVGSNNQRFIYRNALGAWAVIGTGPTGGAVEDILISRQGYIYVTGAFTAFNGVANTAKICRIDPVTGTVTAMGTGLTGGTGGLCLCEDYNGNIWVGGTFTGAGGVLNTAYLAAWDIATGAWTSVSVTNTVTSVNTIACDQTTGYIYVGGQFTQINGVAVNHSARRSTGGTWVALTGITTAVFRKIIVTSQGRVYAAGSFTGSFGLLTGTVWATVSTWDNTISDIVELSDGSVVGVGLFTSIGGQTINRFFQFDGVNFKGFGTGINAVALGARISKYRNGCFFGGTSTSTSVSGLTLTDNVFIWINGTFTFPELKLEGDSYKLWREGPTGIAAAFTNSSGTPNIRYPAVQTIVYRGTEPTTLEFHTYAVSTPGLQYLTCLYNWTTGEWIYLQAPQFLASNRDRHELVYIGGVLRLQSNLRGDLTKYVVPGSSPRLTLVPGENVVGVMGWAFATAAGSVWLDWKRRYTNAGDILS